MNVEAYRAEVIHAIDAIERILQNLMVALAQSHAYENLPNAVNVRQRLDMFRRDWAALCDDIEHN